MAKSDTTRNRVRTVAIAAIVALLAAIWVNTSPSDLFGSSQSRCRCFPGDACWPSSSEWDTLNKTIGGKLIATTPIASPCHDTFAGVDYDAEKCATIQEHWGHPELHLETAHSPMASFFANRSCDPFTPRNAQCQVGAYISYAVKALSASDYQKAISFARNNNIRLVVRNTGHDYMGKSTGPGALAIWTHHIRDKSILDYDSTFFNGKAMKIGAGVLAGEAQALAKTSGYVVVEGDCPTVGIAGGYTQGGGTSPLASRFGLAADQVLEWEVVTAEGALLTATPTKNSDLYWALTGGGGGTYGIVLSMTVRLYQDAPISGATLSFTEPSDAFWNIVKNFLKVLPKVLASGATIYWQILPGNTFSMPQSYFPGGTAQEFENLLQPVLAKLNASGIPYAWSAQDFPSFADVYSMLNPETNVYELNLGGRLIPRSLVATDESTTILVNAIKTVIESGGILAGVSMDVNKPPAIPNSAHPQWRETLFSAFLGTVYDRHNFTAVIAGQRLVTTVLNPALEEITPGGGAYLNQADINQPKWQSTFYGTNYAPLVSIKRKYDPNNLFWGPTAVGSEAWEVTLDGRLCRVKARRL